MAIELVKRGQSVDLTKTNPGLSKVIVGLSWGDKLPGKKDSTDGSVGGFFKRLLGGAERAVTRTLTGDMDIDSTVVLIDGNNRVVETVYYGNRRSRDGSVVHAGDDLTGRDKKGVYDNEEITVDLNRVPANVEKIVVIANIFQAHSRGQHFGQVDAYIRVLKAENREEIIHYDLDDDYSGMTALIVGSLYRHRGEWKFHAIGQGTRDGSIQEVIHTYLR